jgi:DNA (cytosine-5)-methyltransferase 1
MKSNTSNARSATTAGRNDYVATLEAAWVEHLAPRQPDAPTVISTFAGGGGSSLGYSMAGYRELLAVEWDDNAVATFRLNFPDVPLYHGDIAKLSVGDCLKLAGIGPGELDVLDGSPPCQGFSTAGKRLLDDPRNGLFREYVRLLRGLQPKAFVMENVSGMVKGKMKLVFADCLRELKASGYRVRARLLNAMYFGVPQSRERMIFIGVRDDLEVEPSHPAGQSSPIPWVELPLSQGADRWLGRQRFKGCLRHIANQRALGRGFGSHFLDPAKPFPTIPKSLSGAGGIYVRRGSDIRYPTVDELKLAASYPMEYRMAGDFSARWERIGNSVPPLFMRAIAGHVRSLIAVPAISIDGSE